MMNGIIMMTIKNKFIMGWSVNMLSEKEKKYWETLIKKLQDTREDLKDLNDRLENRNEKKN